MKQTQQRQTSQKKSPLQGKRSTSNQSQVSQYQVNIIPDISTTKLIELANPKNPIKSNAKVVKVDIQDDQANKLASGFVRSKRNQTQISSQQIELQNLKQAKDSLIDKLNENLVKLDQLNEEKRQLHDKLLEQIKFVRDLNQATGCDPNDLNQMASSEIKASYQKEKAIHKQLDAQVYKADKERLQLFDRLKQLSKGKEWVQVSHRGQSQIYNDTSQGLLLLQSEINALKQEIVNCQFEITRVRSQLQRSDSDAEFLGKERAIAVLLNERDLIGNKLKEMDMREQHARGSLAVENDKILHFSRQSTSLLRAKSFYNTLKQLVVRQEQKSFQQLCNFANEQHQKTNQLQGLHKVFVQIQRQCLRFSMQSWYARTYNPKQTYQENKDLPKFYKKQDQDLLEKNKYDIKSLSTKVLRLQTGQVLRIVTHVTRQWENRLKVSVFQHWHGQTHPKKQAIQFIQRLVQKYNIARQQQAMSQWKDQVEIVKILIRFNALPIKFATKQLEIRVFQAWRQYTLNRCLKQRSRLLRAFKNLRISAKRTKLQRQLESIVLKSSQEVNSLTKQSCLYQIAIQKEHILFEDAQDQLTQLQPQMEQIQQTNSLLLQEQQHKKLKRAVKAIVINPLRSQLVQILQIWQKNAHTKSYQFKASVRYMVVRVCLQKLRLAFDRFKICESRQNKSMHHSKIDYIHDEILQAQTKNYKIASIVGNEQDRIRQMAFKHLRRLCDQAFSQNLTFWLHKWQQCTQLQRQRIRAVSLFQHKIRKCLLKQAFAKYFRGYSFVVQDKLNRLRVGEVSQRLKFREKKRVFKAIREFARVHVEQTKRLKLVFKMTDRANKVRGMLKWQQITKQAKEYYLLITEKDIVQILDKVQSESSQKSDSLNKQDLENKRLKKIYSMEVTLTLQKWAERFCMGGLQYGFITWKQQSDKIRHRAQFLQNVRRHLVNKFLRTAWSRWQEASANLFIKDGSHYIERMEQQIIDEKTKLKYQQQINQDRLRQLQSEIEPIICETYQFTHKSQVVLELMIRRRNCNYFQFQVRNILQAWSLYSKRQKSSGRALERGVMKLLLQRTFDIIRQSNIKKLLSQIRVKFCARLAKFYKMQRLRIYYNFWRDRNYNIEMQQTRSNRRENSLLIAQRNRFVLETKQHHSILINMQHTKLFMQQIYNGLHEYTFNKAIKRCEAKQLTDAYQCYIKRRSLLKLSQRVQFNNKQNCQIQRVKLHIAKIYCKAVLDCFKQNYLKSKRIARSTYQFASCFMNFQRNNAFKKIKYYSQIRYGANLKFKEQSSRQLLKILDRIRLGRLRFGQTKLQQHVHDGFKLQSVLKQYFINSQVNILRDSFYIWKNNVEKIEVVEFNNTEDGPVNIECWQLRLKCNTLAEMMQDDGAPDQLIQSTIQNMKEKFNYLADKSITRLMINSDKNLMLLPYCLDKLKNYTKVIKKWRYTLNFCNQVVNKNKGKLFRMFKQWKDFNQKAHKVLNGIPYAQLLNRSDMNRINLDQLADNVQNHNEAINKFVDQRGVLFHSLIKGQKLALSLVRNNYERAEQKSMQNLSDYGNSNLQKQIGDQIQRNLETIATLKSKISGIEDENSKISKISDTIRDKAHAAIKNHKLIHQIKQENGDLILQQSENAGTMKLLIEENYQLTKNIQNARVNAKNHFEKAQQIHYQKQIELEQLKREERELISRRQATASYSGTQQLSYKRHGRDERSLSPPEIISPSTTQRLRHQRQLSHGKSPLRLRNLSQSSQQ